MSPRAENRVLIKLGIALVVVASLSFGKALYWVWMAVFG